MNRSKKNERLGQVFTNKYGCVFKIVEYNNTKDLIVEFQDEHKHRQHTQYSVCLKGEVFNPYFKSVYGVGYKGVTNYTGSQREYTLWHGMMGRCYSEKIQAKNPTYVGCQVCERWHCFANFVEDLPLIKGYDLWKNNPSQRVSLDKDVLGNSKIYSLETCCFITIEDNSRERNIRKPVGTRELVSVDIKTGQVYSYPSMMEAERQGFNRAGIWKCCKGDYSNHKERKWYYKEDYQEMVNNGEN